MVRRREIADAALLVIGEQGASALTAASIATEVGVTSGALFRHFATLSEVVEAAVERAVDAAEATIPAREGAPIDRLMRIAGARIELFRRNPGMAWLLLSDQVYLSVPEGAIVRLRSLVRRTRRFLLETIREGVAEGSIRSDIEPEYLLMVFTGTVHAALGPAGVHREEAAPSAEPVLAALRSLLCPGPTLHPLPQKEDQ